MATNDFLVFGGGSSPNVIDQATYAALTARLSGFQSGTALSAQLNKVWRQSSIMAAVLAQFTANFSGQNSVDDGTIATLLANLQAAINAAGITAPQFDNTAKLATTAFVQRAGGNFQTRKYVVGSGTLAVSDTGSWIQAGGNGPSTITLPAPTTVNLTYTITNVTNNSSSVTIATPSANIYNQAMGAPTFLIDVGATVELVSDGSNWTIVSHYTRSPIAQTPAQYDNSSRIATTAFVKQSGAAFSGIQGINATASLNGGHVGAFIWAYGAGITLTLPPVASVPNGATITIGTPVGMTVKGNGTENINSQVGGLSNTFALNAGEQAQFVSNTGAWYLSSYTTVLGTTSPQFDNSNKLATTAFVQRALGNFGSFTAFNVNTTLSAFYAGQAIQWFGASGGTLTLPSGSSMPSGGAILFLNVGSGPLAIATQGADFIWSNGNVQPVTLQVGDSLLLVSRGSTEWDVAGGTAAIQFAQVRGVTAAQFDNSTRLATTAFVQRSTGAVVGSMRNAAMSVTSASASATFTADEVVVETALGGAAFRIANFNKTINLATTGAGGMDTGSAPASGFVALYAIYNPATQATALLATNATSSTAPNVYGGANMPSGYTASALVSVWQTTSGGLLNVGSQFGRTISTPGFTVLNTTVSAASYISFSVAGAVPPNAKTCRGYQAISGNTASAGLSSNIAGSSGGVGAVGQGGTMPTNASSVTTSFPHVPLVTPQTLYYIAAASSGTLTFTVGLYEYTF
ncbi:hypothetical protein [Burkholderia cepacia]|uniref:hypothetical protein n=1 Tax=Burkholderia cepacia TaxID=292 RepID=UPI001CF468F2|nr:hypothetical protein [Burkholderia cepacia]MCA8160545.1 hypothetical protein [Burkholderia cepacia]